MKNCPNCNEQLPDEVHFCPTCMYHYIEADFDKISSKPPIPQKVKKRRKLVLIVTSITIMLIAGTSFAGYKMYQYIRKQLAPPEREVVSFEDEFRIDDHIPYDENIEFDLRYNLRNFEKLKDLLGEETAAPYEEGIYTVHVFDEVEVRINRAGEMPLISIFYDDKTKLNRCGVFGISGTSTYEDVRAILGKPDQVTNGTEMLFQFDAYDEENEVWQPYLLVVFSKDKTKVLRLEYYYMEYR